MPASNMGSNGVGWLGKGKPITSSSQQVDDSLLRCSGAQPTNTLSGRLISWFTLLAHPGGNYWNTVGAEA